jgi:multidrug efflux pump subunit AcrA (membrane-fusion protein)
VKSPIAGTLISILPVGAKLRAGVMLARIRESGNVQEFRAPVDGEIASVSAKEGDTVTLGQTVATLKPDRTTVLDALRALAYVGTKDDLPVIEASTPIDQSSEIAVQAAAAVKAIRSR